MSRGSNIGGIIAGSLFAGAGGVVVACLIAAFSPGAPANPTPAQVAPVVITGFLIGAGLVVAISIGFGLRERRQAQEVRDDRVLADLRAADAYAASIKSNLQGEAQQAVTHLAQMPERLQSAATSYARARATFADGAFSPFWSAVEQSYRYLADYRAAAASVEANARQYANCAAILVRTGKASADDIPAFPVQLDTERVESAHRELLTQLDALVYDAQKVPTFATIWEQRRTTAAVIAGFQNLEQAVAGMQAGLRASLSELGVALTESNAKVSIAVEGLRSDSQEAADREREASKELNDHAVAVRDMLYYPQIAHLLH